jgi:PIN domain nuclease of toxin-antitoxin system
LVALVLDLDEQGRGYEHAWAGKLDNGYGELSIASEHVVASEGLPPIHKDPFDRILVAQATMEGITLITNDVLLAQYPGPIRTV